ncbi:MAG: hypothetical protein JSS30_07125 [Verrucomicrobia bacterium]|nr:hypothetical protein [Verrucomicrobiota bacterium]
MVKPIDAIKNYGKEFVSLEAQKADEAKFSQDIDQLKEKVDSFGKRVVNFLEGTVHTTLNAPIARFQNFVLAQPQVDEDGEELPLSLGEKLGNYHKNVLIKSDEVARNAGEKAFLATRKTFSFLQKGGKLLGRENMGATIQDTIALVIQSIVRGILFLLGQTAHLRTPAAAVGIGLAAAATIAVPQVACGILAFKTHNLSNEVKDLKAELKAERRAVAKAAAKAAEEQANTAARNKVIRNVVIATAATAAIAAGVYYFGVPTVVSNAAEKVVDASKFVAGKASDAASVVAEKASAAASTVGGYASTAASVVGEKASAAASTVAGAASTVASTVGGYASPVLSTVGGYASTAASATAGKASDAFNLIRSMIPTRVPFFGAAAVSA